MQKSPIPTFLEIYKNKSLPFLDKFFSKKILEAREAGTISKEILGHIYDLSKKGKKIRGFLVVLGYMLAGGGNEKRIYDTSTFIEIAQTALLIHDDIMDEDDRRRDQKTIHNIYEDIGKKTNIKPSPKRYGENMGICAGDIAFYLSWEKLVTGNFPASRLLEASSLYASCFTRVAYGQALDISPTSRELSEKEILAIYRLKTAEYSAVLPLHIGAVLADGNNKDFLSNLEAYGLALGLAFQMQDDILGMYGDSQTTGKPVGSDIREGKQTLLVAHFLKNATEEQRSYFKTVYGIPDISKNDILTIQNIMKTSGSYDYVIALGKEYLEKGCKTISKITKKPNFRQILDNLLTYAIHRIQ